MAELKARTDSKFMSERTEIALSLAPALRSLVEASGADPARLMVSFETCAQGHVHFKDKHSVVASDGDKLVQWSIPSLGELFRGDRVPPADIEQYSPEYVSYFLFIEGQLVTLCDAIGDRTDQEMEEIYAALRRRPDGRSLGPTHDFMWQVSALLLGKHVLSAAEFEGIMGALLRSARAWALRPVSRFYLAYLRRGFDDA